MDTRTPRTPDPSGRKPGDSRQGGPSGFFDDGPVLSTVKVPSDPAEVVVTHASFRVELGSLGDSATETAGTGTSGHIPAVRGMTVAGPSAEPFAAGSPGPSAESSAAGSSQAGSSAPYPDQDLVWGADAGPAATRLSPAARPGGPHAPESAASTTQVLPRIEEDAAAPGTIVGPRVPQPPDSARTQPLLKGVRPARGAYDGPETGESDAYGPHGAEAGGAEDGTGHAGGRGDGEPGPYGERPLAQGEFEDAASEARARVRGSLLPGAGRQAYYPGRRMSLGVVLLPLRVFLGFICVYAGMGKLYDPVYFDGDARGSLVTWLRSLEPWAVASPLRDFALTHPVGSGLTVAFLQIIIGVLTVCGLWQRLAASVGALLSAALLMTVSWSSVPAYEAPDIILLAAWSPLIIAGAPVYSVDGRLAADAWRKLGPRAELGELRLRVLRRGALIACVITGLAMLTGAMLGGAVRASHMAKMPEPEKPPTNRLPGSPLPEEPGARTDSGRPADGRTRDADAGAGSRRTGGPSSAASPGEGRRGDPSGPSQRETVQAPQQTAPGAQPPRHSAPGTRATQGGGGSVTGGGGSGGTGGGTASGGSDSGGGNDGSSAQDGGGSSSSGGGGGLGGLLG